MRVGKNKIRQFVIAAVCATALLSLMGMGKKGKNANDFWEKKAEMSLGRALIGTAVIGDNIYTIGGTTDDNTALDLNEAYSVSKQRITVLAPMPTPRADFGIGVLGGKIYVVGGYDADNENYFLGNVEVYDPATNTWTKKAPLPTPRSGLAVGVINGKLYAVGGNCDHNWESGCVYMVEEYNPKTDSWTVKEALPSPRSDLVVGVSGGKLYAIGGALREGGQWYYFGNVEEFDPATNTWKNKKPMPTLRSDCALAVLGGKFYIAGGICTIEGSKHSLTLNDIEVYDPSRDRWTKTFPLSGVRFSLGLAGVRGKLYSVGGIVRSEHVKTIEACSP